ncbi:uncharacterized protein TNCV_521061 [Trichonephila clavipes]|nr:uncharacterized protein TNCV_521061 [Trichonephila clavipes]
MSSRHHIDDFMRGRIIGKIEERRKITDVAREFDIAHSVVSRLWKSFKTTGMCSRRHGEVVLEVPRLQKTDISSYQQKGTCGPQLSRQVAGRNYPPTNKNTLIRALTEEWDKLPQQLLDNDVQSMVERALTKENGDHAPASSTTCRIIMSESSDYMELSPSKFDQVSACAKLRDTVTGISALHLSIHGMDGRSPSPGNSFMDMYISGKQAMIRRKEEMVNKSKKKFSKKRKQKGKDSTEEFIFPKKTARPISPTSTQDPIETNNSFSDLEQDVEHPPSIETVTTEVVTPKIPPPHPTMLKIKDNFREQIKCISEKFPNLRNRIVNDVVKMFSTDHEEYRKLKHFLETDKDFEFYILKRQKDKPIKAVIKGLPNSALITDITNDLKLIGFNIDTCTQLISKRTKNPSHIS